MGSQGVTKDKTGTVATNEGLLGSRLFGRRPRASGRLLGKSPGPFDAGCSSVRRLLRRGRFVGGSRLRLELGLASGAVGAGCTCNTGVTGCSTSRKHLDQAAASKRGRFDRCSCSSGPDRGVT